MSCITPTQLSCLSGIIVVFYDYFGAFKQPATVVEFKSASTLPFLFGVVIYSYEGVGMILPVEASMKRKEKFPLTLTFVMTVITIIYVSFGAVSLPALLQMLQQKGTTCLVQWHCNSARQPFDVWHPASS